jgi:hypothetical protein
VITKCAIGWKLRMIANTNTLMGVESRPNIDEWRCYVRRMSDAPPPETSPSAETYPPTEPVASSRESAQHGWILAGLLIVSLLPMLFLRLQDASQLASALALPLAVVLAGLPTLPAVRRHDRDRPLPWRRILVIGSAVVALLGGAGVAYAVWQNTKDIPVTLANGPGTAAHWTNNSFNDLSVPGHPPARSFVRIVVSLHNPDSTGDCERTAKVDFTPILDGHARTPVADTVPGAGIDVPIGGAIRTAQVRITLHWDQGNANCQVDLQIDRATLHD